MPIFANSLPWQKSHSNFSTKQPSKKKYFLTLEILSGHCPVSTYPAKPCLGKKTPCFNSHWCWQIEEISVIQLSGVQWHLRISIIVQLDEHEELMQVFYNMDPGKEQGSFFSRKSATASASVTTSPFLAPPPETRNRKSSGQGGQKLSAIFERPRKFIVSLL